MDISPRFTLGLAIGAVVIFAGWKTRSLSASGAVAAAVIGTVAAAAGPFWVVLLLGYFVTATAVSRLGRARKRERTAGMLEKEGARDARQVLSNGLAFALSAAGSVAGLGSPEIFEILSTGALAASAADTWATEVGTLWGGTPRSILTGRRLAVGASGGVTVAGFAGSIVGASLVTLIADIHPRYFIWIVLGGLAGAVADSIAGALIQRRLWCDACGSPTEMRIHTCGAPTRRVGGLSFVENDGVNLLATFVGAITTFYLVGMFA
jgi:uncharacterized protein (TIGR00297 family)